MLVISAYDPARMTSRVHSHSGWKPSTPVEGEQYLETTDNAYRINKGDTLVVPTGVTMRLVGYSSPNPRRAFAVIVYDSSKHPVA